MHPSIHAKSAADKPAIIMSPSGETLTYGELDARSNQIAQLFRELGVKPGDAIAFSMENCATFFELAWAAQRSGLYYVTISNRLQTDEIAYILADCAAKVFVTSSALGTVPAELASRNLDIALFSVGETMQGYRDLESERAKQSAEPVADEQAGFDMLYSSGTTGRPKGIKPRAIVGEPVTTADTLVDLQTKLYGVSADSIYLCPAPVYHAAPLKWTMAIHRIGATAVIMEKFDPEGALAAIGQFAITIAQFVPTHFVRMLKLPKDVRDRYDLSSLRCVIHAAAPCPIPIKEAMIEWLGPIIHEYYSGSEGNGGTFISSQDWLAHKGSVGRPLTTKLHICDEAGMEVPPRTEGTIYFSGGPAFEYHNDAEKTQESRHSEGWTTLGDVGWVDEEGFLYLTDRKSFMIISGGVNIYPQEIENLLVTHPKVADAAVIGAPDEEMGEKVVAVVQPLDWNDAGQALAGELTAFARASLSHVKAPRQIDFMQELPRHATGKLYKRIIRDRYWSEQKLPPSP